MAFHPYPRVIPPVFNPGGFGPPRGLTPASACPRIAHPASRPRRATETPVSDSLSLRLASRLGLAAQRDSLAHSTKGTPSRPLSCRSGCSGARGFRCCFTPLPGCFSPFPRGTGSLSVAGECSDLEGGPPGFGPDSPWPALLGKGGRAAGTASPTGLSPPAAGLPRPFGCRAGFSPRPGSQAPGRLPPQPRRPSALKL